MSNRLADEKGGEYRSPPKNLEAEQALLGAILVNNEAIHRVANFLEPEHFILPVHGRIYSAVMQMVGRRETANPVTLKPFFENDEALTEAGGGQYLARLAGSAATVINAGHYGRAIHDLHVRRALIAFAEDVRDAAYDAPLDQPPAEQAERAESRIHEILQGAPGTGSERRSIGTAMREAAEDVEKAYQADGALLGLPVGIRAMERRVGGLQAPDMIVLGGRPGMGKTGMALGIALAVAQAGHAVLYASLEMSAGQLGKRALSILTGLSHHLMQMGQITQSDFDVVYRGIAAVQGVAARDRRHRRPDARLHRAHSTPAQAAGPARPSDRGSPATHAFAAGDSHSGARPADHRVHDAHEGAGEGAGHPRALALATESGRRARRQQGAAIVGLAGFRLH